MRIWLERFRKWLFLCLGACLFAALLGTACAAPLPSQSQVTSVDLEPHASLLLDPTGTLSIEEVSSPARATDFVKFQGPLSLGFTQSVAWIKIDLKAGESSQWLLEVGQPILEDVRF